MMITPPKSSDAYLQGYSGFRYICRNNFRPSGGVVGLEELGYSLPYNTRGCETRDHLLSFSFFNLRYLSHFSTNDALSLCMTFYRVQQPFIDCGK
jgi:hypothetical protein